MQLELSGPTNEVECDLESEPRSRNQRSVTNGIVSRERVQEHGEVYTSEREVDAMLDLVEHETKRIDSRFLEPACGTGNFLAPVLQRKLDVVSSRYGKHQLDYERYAILAVSSLYGIDILEDNVVHCRERLLSMVAEDYRHLFKQGVKPTFFESTTAILFRNIIWGDALTLRTVSEPPMAIVFSEWTFVSGSLFQRRDFFFSELLEHEALKELPLFSDMGEKVFIPTAFAEYPPVHFLEIANASP